MALLLGAGVVQIAAVYLVGAVLALLLAFGLQFAHVARPPLELDLKRWPGLMLAAAPVGLFTVFAVTLFRVDDDARGVRVEGRRRRVRRRLPPARGDPVPELGRRRGDLPLLARLTRTSRRSLALVFSLRSSSRDRLDAAVAVGAAVLADPLVDLIYGPDYDQAGLALALLAPTIALYPVSYVSGGLLIAQDRAGLLTKVYVVITVENIAANLVLIPWLSLYGAALSTSISQLLLTAWLIVLARRTAGDLPWPRVLAGPALAAGAAALAMAALHDRLGLAVAAGAAAYLGCSSRSSPGVLRRRPGRQTPAPSTWLALDER